MGDGCHEYDEKCRGNDTALFDARFDLKRLSFTIRREDCSIHVIVEKSEDLNKLFRASEGGEDFPSSSLGTESKALVRSTKVLYRSWCCSLHFSWS